MMDYFFQTQRLVVMTPHDPSGNKNRFSSSANLYDAFNTLPIDKLFALSLLSYAHALFNHSPSLPRFFHSKVQFNSNIHDHATRSKDDFHILQTNTKSGSKLSYYKASILWNTLPQEIKDLQAVNLFKMATKRFLSYSIS